MGKKKQPKRKTTLQKGGKYPPDITLEDIAEDVSKYFKGLPKFKQYKNEIEEKYGIRKQHDDYWPDDDIKKVWGKTQRLAKTSKRRECLSQAIILQLIKRSLALDKGVNAASESQLSTSSEKEDDWQVKSKKFNPMYIQIPLSVISDKVLSDKEFKPAEVQNKDPTHKLIDRVPNFTAIKKRKSYAMLYDNRTRNAAWVYEILNSKNKTISVKRNDQISYKLDESIHPFYQASENSYTPPYNRGHLAAAANHSWCQEAYEDTFLLSNISPQHKDLNKGIWEELERKCRNKIGSQNSHNVHVYTGPLYLPKDNNSNVVNYEMMGGKAVPTHFFKVIIVEKDNRKVNLECYKIPNKKPDKKLKEYKVKIKEIEEDSGLIFTERIGQKRGIDSIRIVTWKDKEKKNTASTKVRICTPLTDYEDCAQSV